MSSQSLPPLTPEEHAILFEKHTERPGTGEYLHNKAPGLYVCRNCGNPLYQSTDKFESGCGWPSFDAEIAGHVTRLPDADGSRTEIVCSNCGVHLGHVFLGEGFTPANTRHCVNSRSMLFVPTGAPLPTVKPGHLQSDAEDGTALSLFAHTTQAPLQQATAVFAGGCFWGVEHLFSLAPGVLDAQSGYSGGQTSEPTYEQVCSGRTGHAESVRVTYDPTVTSYTALAKLFFELHDPTQLDRQGPDVGSQYRSIIFYATPDERTIAETLIRQLENNGYDVVTAVQPTAPFYPAEAYHQDFLVKHPGRPCHMPVKRFHTPAPAR